MDLGDIAENTSRGKSGSALITIILAGFLWVGKTTFEHVGQIAGLQHELETTHQDSSSLRNQYDRIVGMLNERTKSRFTREDADKLVEMIREVDARQNALKDGCVRDFADLKIEIGAVASGPNAPPTPTTYAPAASPVGNGSVGAAKQIEHLEDEIASLQASLARLQRQVTRSGENITSQPVGAIAAKPRLERVPLTNR